MAIPENIKALLNPNVIAAALLFAMTVIILVGIIKLLFRKKQSQNSNNAPDTAKKNKSSDPYEHCELNEIMGYDFIQIKTPDLKQTVVKEVPIKKAPSFNDSEGIGMTEMPVKTTGASSQTYEDEPVLTREQRQENIKQEEKNKKFEEQAKQEQKTLASDDTMEILLGKTPWPEKHDDYGEMSDEDYEEILEQALLEQQSEIETNEDEDISDLQREPEDKQSYDELQKRQFEFLDEYEMQEALSGQNLTEEEKQAIRELDDD